MDQHENHRVPETETGRNQFCYRTHRWQNAGEAYDDPGDRGRRGTGGIFHKSDPTTPQVVSNVQEEEPSFLWRNNINMDKSGGRVRHGTVDKEAHKLHETVLHISDTPNGRARRTEPRTGPRCDESAPPPNADSRKGLRQPQHAAPRHGCIPVATPGREEDQVTAGMPHTETVQFISYLSTFYSRNTGYLLNYESLNECL